MNILVTGGGSGLGAAIVKRLSSNQKNRVFFTYKNSKAHGEPNESQSSNTQSLHCDFGNSESLNALIEDMDNMSLNVVVNNALPHFQTKHFHQHTSAELMESFRLNVLSTTQITQKAISIFRKQKAGKIITILTSYLTNKPPIGLSEYVANKAYLLSLSKSWGVENSRFNITSNSISPSMMLTKLNKEIDERNIELFLKNTPFGEFVRPDEVADAVNYFVNAPKHVNGVNFLMNGGIDVI